MNIVFTPQAWDDYQYWQHTDEKLLEKINLLIKDCIRNHFKGLGKPEPLKGDLSGIWSRRISDKHRLMYEVQDDVIILLSCFGHYDDK